MPMFEVIIEETVSETFRVEARDADEAENIARERYRSGEIVLSPGECQEMRAWVVGEV